MPPKLTNEEFINSSKKIHGSKYDYSLVEYKNCSSKIEINCPTHGIFKQIPSVHLSGCGCTKCGYEKVGMQSQLSNNEFMIKARNVHNNKYDYSLVEYKNSLLKVKIICPIHNIFEQTPSDHLSGCGCVICGKINRGNKSRLTQSEFIEKANLIHNNKYDYSEVIYVDVKTKINIKCPKHSEFEQTPNSHLNGNGCPKCVGRNKTTEEFINEANIIHNNKYAYSLVNYVNSKIKIKIVCPEHGEFEQIPNNHLNGAGCHKCNGGFMDEKFFIEKSNKIHKNKYDYSLVNYSNVLTKIKIICSKHGIFTQAPSDHLHGAGCPKCKRSKGEIKICNYLMEKNISFDEEKCFNNCRNKTKLYFDFYLPEYNMCIEYDGIQHFKPINYFGGENTFILQQKKDKIKTDYCTDNNIKLLRIKYNENIEEKLNKFF